MKRSTLLMALAMGLSLMATGAQAAPKKGAGKTLSGVLNLNQASQAQLDELPGVGPKAAERIIAFRQKTPFTRVEDLVKVKGFGKKKLEKLKGHLSVNGPTTLKVESSGDEAPAASALPQAQGRAALPAKR